MGYRYGGSLFQWEHQARRAAVESWLTASGAFSLPEEIDREDIRGDDLPEWLDNAGFSADSMGQMIDDIESIGVKVL